MLLSTSTGASEVSYKNLGAMPLLLWRAIQESKSTGAREFSLGRSDEAQCRSNCFQESLDHDSTPLVYWRYPGPVSPEFKRELESRHGKAGFRGYADACSGRDGKVNLPSHRVVKEVFDAR